MRNALQKSLDKKWCIHFLTNHPEGDAYDGVVIHLAKSLVVMHEFRDFVADGILVFPRKSVVSVRNGDFEVCENRILKRSGEIKSVKKIDWLKNIHSVKDLLSSLSKRNIWPAIEELKDGKSALYVGPITGIKKNSFMIYCYDAAGNWEDAYDIDYRNVYRIEFNSKYLNYFNEYMRACNGTPNRDAAKSSRVHLLICGERYLLSE